jgi:hypothetical protein
VTFRRLLFCLLAVLLLCGSGLAAGPLNGGVSTGMSGFYVTGLTTSFSGPVSTGTGTFDVCFSATPTVTGGTPTLNLNTTPTASTATFSSVSGSCMVFRYLVDANQNANPVATTSAAVDLRGASVKNGSTNADLSIANNWIFTGVSFEPIGTPASILSIVISPSTGLLTATSGSNTATVSITFNASITALGSNVLKLSDGVACPIAPTTGMVLTASCTFTSGADTPIAAANTYLGTASSATITGGTISNGGGPASLANANNVVFPGLSVDTTSPYFASPRGSGLQCSLESPCSLSGAQTKARSALKHIWLLGGRYSTADNCSKITIVGFKPVSVSASYCFTRADNGEAWLGYPGQTPVLDGGSTAYGNGVSIAFASTGVTNFTINRITFQHYGLSAMDFESPNGLYIWNSTEQNIYTTPNSISGCLSYRNYWTNVVYNQNLCQDIGSMGVAGSSGLTASAGNGGFSFNQTFDNNIVLNTCQIMTDCGGLYPGYVPGGTQVAFRSCCFITNNIVGNIGASLSNNGKGIYLDDYSSNQTVTGNLIYGIMQWCYQVHNGANNIFSNNVCDITQISLESSQDPSGNPAWVYVVDSADTYGFAGNAPGNTITKNIVYNGNTSYGPPPYLVIYENDGKTLDVPYDSGNQYYTVFGSFANPSYSPHSWDSRTGMV